MVSNSLETTTTKRGHRPRDDAVTDEAIPTRAPTMATWAACTALCATRAGYYRRRAPAKWSRDLEGVEWAGGVAGVAAERGGDVGGAGQA